MFVSVCTFVRLCMFVFVFLCLSVSVCGVGVRMPICVVQISELVS